MQASNYLTINIQIYRKGNVVNHRYWDVRSTGKLVTPLVVAAKLSAEWFCPKCLADLTQIVYERRSQYLLCPRCGSGLPWQHSSLQIEPQCLLCVGDCPLGHRHQLSLPHDRRPSPLRFTHDVGLSEKRIAHYGREESKLQEELNASFAKLCFMRERLQPRDVHDGGMHFHIGLNVKVGHHFFSYEQQLSNPKGVGCSTLCQSHFIPGCDPMLMISHARDDGQDASMSRIAFRTLSVQEDKSNLVVFPGLLSPALLCTARGMKLGHSTRSSSTSNNGSSGSRERSPIHSSEGSSLGFSPISPSVASTSSSGGISVINNDDNNNNNNNNSNMTSPCPVEVINSSGTLPKSSTQMGPPNSSSFNSRHPLQLNLSLLKKESDHGMLMMNLGPSANSSSSNATSISSYDNVANMIGSSGIGSFLAPPHSLHQQVYPSQQITPPPNLSYSVQNLSVSRNLQLNPTLQPVSALIQPPPPSMQNPALITSMASPNASPMTGTIPNPGQLLHFSNGHRNHSHRSDHSDHSKHQNDNVTELVKQVIKVASDFSDNDRIRLIQSIVDGLGMADYFCLSSYQTVTNETTWDTEDSYTHGDPFLSEYDTSEVEGSMDQDMDNFDPFDNRDFG